MALDISEPLSPGWWLARLGWKLIYEREDHTILDYRQFPETVPGLNRLRAYAEGHPPIPHVPGIDPLTASEWMRDARTNWSALVIDSPAERLGVDGFLFGSDSGETADSEAQEIWQENGMDAESDLVHYGALSQRRSFVIVDKNTDGRPRLLHKTAYQVAVEYDPHDPRKVIAALYLHLDDWTGNTRATLWTPDMQVYDYVSPLTEVVFPERGIALDSWEVFSLPSGGLPTDTTNTLGQIPVVPFVNRRNKRRAGFAEHEDVMSIQNRINLSLINLMSAMKYGAFKQRWIAGLEVDEDPITGEKISPFQLDVKTLWTVDDAEAKFGEYSATDLRPYIAAVESAVQDLAAISKTPPHYLLGQIVNVSGDALKAAETGLVSKVRAKQREFGESWENVMRLAFKVIGDEERATDWNAETIWRDPESRTVGELADASVKKSSAGVPWRQRMIDLQYTPQQIDRMEIDRAADALLTPNPDLMTRQTVTVAQPGVDPATGQPIIPSTSQPASQPPTDPRAVIGRGNTSEAPVSDAA